MNTFTTSINEHVIGLHVRVICKSYVALTDYRPTCITKGCLYRYLYTTTYYSPRESEEYVLPALVCVSVCLSVCDHETKKIVDGFVPNFTGRFLGAKGRPSSCFVTIGRGMWK